MSELAPNLQPFVRGMLQERIAIIGEQVEGGLKSGINTIAHINVRKMISYPELFASATCAYIDSLRESKMLIKSESRPRHLDPLPEAATLYGGSVARIIGASLIYHRVNAKGYGKHEEFEGNYKPKDEIIILDDAITSGGSIINEANDLSIVDLKPAGAVVLVDREQGGRTRLTELGIPFAAAMTLKQIADFALAESLGGVTQTIHDDLMCEFDANEIAQSKQS